MSDSVPSSSIHQIRRDNLRALLVKFSAAKLAEGLPSKGVELQFAEHIGVSPVTLCHMKRSRNISDKMAAQIESKTGIGAGCLDLPQQEPLPSPGLQAFLLLASGVWRAGNAIERRRLMTMAKCGFAQTHRFNQPECSL